MQQDIARIGAVKKTEANDDKNNIVTSETRTNYEQDAPLYAPPGIDAPPLKDDRVILVRVEGTGKFAVIGYLGETQGAEPGEVILYSRNENGEAQAVLKLLKDGKMEAAAPEAISVQTEKDFSLEAKEKATVKGKEVEINGKVTVTGGELNCAGTVVPDGTGCLCGMPFCAMTGAPQTGSKASNT